MVRRSRSQRSSLAESLPSEAGAGALESAYREHCGFVWRNARRLGCDETTAEDVVHDVFLVAARRLSEFRQESTLRTWLFAITYRVVQRRFRDQARRGARLRDYAAHRGPVPVYRPQDRVDAGEALRCLLMRLEETKRVVFILSELEGMTSVEIGDCLGVNPRTVESRLRAARAELERLCERERCKEGGRRP